MSTLHEKTHVTIGNEIHIIASIEEHVSGPGHTHRVHLGCGMTVDVDIDGEKARARALERLDHVEKEFRKVHEAALRKHHMSQHLKAAEDAKTNCEKLDGGRWHTGAKAKGCADCEAHENGAPAVIQDLGHTPAKTVEADIETNISCPTCGSKIYKRRKDSTFACTGQGHEYTQAELLEHLKMGLLTLISGEIDPEQGLK